MAAVEKVSRCPSIPRKAAAERLREVASALFYRRGIRAVGVDEIVSETGVTKPTLYRSYASKDELVSVCLLQKIAELQARLDAIEQRDGDDPLAQVRAIVALFAGDIAGPDFRGCAVMNAAVEFPEPDHPVRAVSERSKGELRGRIAALARRLPTDDPDILADGLILLIEGASTSRHISGSQGPSAALVKAADALLRAYLR